MAIVFDANLGGRTVTGAAISVTLTTGAAAAAGTRVFLWGGNFGTETPVSVADNSGNGYTWVRDFLADDANNVTGAWFSADTPAGLASGTVITLTYSGAGAASRCIAAFSATGVATGASGYLDGTAGFTAEFGTTDWVTPNITPAGDAILVSGVLADGAAGNTGTVTSPATEVNDVWDATTTIEILTGYRIVTPATYSIAGTFGTAPGEQKYAVAGYKAAAGAGGLFKPIRPMVMRLHRFTPLRSPFRPWPQYWDVPVAQDVTAVAGAATALGVTPAPVVDVRSINASAVALGISPAPAVSVLSVNTSALALGSSPAPAVDVRSVNGPAIALGSAPAPTVLAAVPVTSSVALGITPAPVKLVTVFPTAALALGVTPTATAVVGGGDVTVPVSAALALGSTSAPTVLVTILPVPASALGVAPTPASSVAKAVTAALALGITPAPALLVASPVSAALALGVTGAPVVLVRVFPTAALAIGSTPAPTVIIGSAVIAVASAAVAVGSTPAPIVLVVRPVTAALAAGSTPSPAVRIVRAVTAALAAGSAPAPTVSIGGFIPTVPASISVVDIPPGQAVVLIEAVGAAVTAADVAVVIASMVDLVTNEALVQDTTGPDVRVLETVP